MEAARGLRLLKSVWDIRDIYALRLACTAAVPVAQVMLTQEMCQLLENAERPNYGSHSPRTLNKYAMITALGLMAPKGDARSIRFLGGLLEQGDDDIRTLAVDSYIQVAGSSTESSLDLTKMGYRSQYAFSQAALRMSHQMPQVRTSAIYLVSHIALPGDKRCQQLLLSLVKDPECSVRTVAIETLGELTEKGNQTVIRAIMKTMLAECDTRTKNAAEDAVALIARGDGPTIDVLCSKLKAHDEEVRLQSLKTLGRIACVNDQRVVSAVIALLARSASNAHIVGKQTNDSKTLTGKVRAAALFTLGKVATKGDKTVLRAICPCVHERDDVAVVEAAIRAVGSVAEPGDRRAARVLGTVFSEQFRVDFQGPQYRVHTMRLSALEMLAHLGEGGDEYVLEVVSSLFRDKEADLRKHAVTSAGRMAKRGDPLAARLIRDVAQHDQDQTVRASAARSLELVGEPVMMSATRIAVNMTMFMTLLLLSTFLAVFFIMGLRELFMLMGCSLHNSTFLSILIPVIIGLFTRHRRRVFYRCCPALFKDFYSAEYGSQYGTACLQGPWGSGGGDRQRPVIASNTSGRTCFLNLGHSCV
jgi:HEAT repeat protein